MIDQAICWLLVLLFSMAHQDLLRDPSKPQNFASAEQGTATAASYVAAAVTPLDRP